MEAGVSCDGASEMANAKMEEDGEWEDEEEEIANDRKGKKPGLKTR